MQIYQKLSTVEANSIQFTIRKTPNGNHVSENRAKFTMAPWYLCKSILVMGPQCSKHLLQLATRQIVDLLTDKLITFYFTIYLHEHGFIAILVPTTTFGVAKLYRIGFRIFGSISFWKWIRICQNREITEVFVMSHYLAVSKCRMYIKYFIHTDNQIG